MPVYQKRGRFYCVYYDGPKRVWEPFGEGPAAKAQAEARDLEIKLKKRRGQWREQAVHSSLVFRDLAQMYLEARATEIAANTRDCILRTVSKFALPYIGAKPITSINLEDWQRIQTKMIEDGLKNRTINTYFTYLSRIFTWAVDENDGLLTDHPWRKRKPLKIREKFRPDLLTVEEFNLIRAHAEPHLSWAMEVAFHTGVWTGPSELFSLKWSDVDWDNSRIQVYSPKTDTVHWQFLSQSFMDRLSQQNKLARKNQPACPFVVSYQGQQVKSLKTTWKAAKAKAGIDRRIRMSDIRHLHITYALAGGAPIAELAERVGHVNTRMIVNVYAHLAKDLQTNKAFNLPDIYGEK